MKISIFTACLFACPIFCTQQETKPVNPAEFINRCARDNPGKNVFVFFTENHMEVDNSKSATSSQKVHQDNTLAAPHPVAAGALMLGFVGFIVRCAWDFYKAL